MLLEVMITLKSDLAPGTGYSYAGVIDSDVSYTDEGLPYIPARRIKGCLREAAALIGTEHTAEIFGLRGSRKPGSLRLSNAYLAEHEALAETFRYMAKRNPRIFSKENMLRKFTSVKAQTRIGETGTAQDNTLRFTRTINHFGRDGRENVFVLKAEVDEAYAEEAERCFKALRHIGSDRNRGLGNIRCTVRRTDMAQTAAAQDFRDEELYKITYTVRNVQPLMLTGESDAESSDYINGASVLGYFASHYKGEPESDEFRDLFLNEKTVYSNLYPAEAGRRMVPPLRNINKLKKTGAYVNILGDLSRIDEKDKDAFDTANGNQPKNLRKFMWLENGEVMLHEVEKQVTYHHSRTVDENNPDSVLYSLEHISEGQQFAGWITAKGKYVPYLLGTLRSFAPYFGKSRSAQYGRCEVTEIGVDPVVEESVTYHAGTLLCVGLMSDAVLMSPGGYFTADAHEAKKIIAEELGIRYQDDPGKDLVGTKYITGYNTKWNLKKPSFSAVAAGSIFVYPLSGDCTITGRMIGEKNQEGFGEIRLYDFTDTGYAVQAREEQAKDPAALKNVQPVACEMLVDSLIDGLFLRKKAGRLGESAARLGRVTLMLKQAEDRADFIRRIESIKTGNDDSDKEEKRIVNYFTRLLGDEDGVLAGAEQTDEYRLLREITDRKTADRLVRARWKEYLLMLLTDEKYSLAGKENGGAR